MFMPGFLSVFVKPLCFMLRCITKRCAIKFHQFYIQVNFCGSVERDGMFVGGRDETFLRISGNFPAVITCCV